MSVVSRPRKASIAAEPVGKALGRRLHRSEQDEPDPFDDESRFDAGETKLDELRLRPGQEFEYLFDFGDSWWHEGTVEAVNPSVPRARYPQIRESRGASPPQYESVDE